MEHLAAVQFAKHLENAGNLPAGGRFWPAFACAAEVRAQVAVTRILEHQAVQDAPAVTDQRKVVEYANGSGMTVEELAEIRFADPAVDSCADLDADSFWNRRRAAEPSGEI